MKSTRQIQRDARRLFRVCLVEGTLDEGRVRRVVERSVEAQRPGSLRVLTRFQRLVRLHRAAHSARVESARPLPADVQASIRAGIARLYGPAIATEFVDNPQVLGGVRITVGSDVFDGSVAGRLGELEKGF
jgi:F-type H+-transporting ATPase subunit delta